MKPPEVSIVADEILTSLKTKGSPRRMLSSTFWTQFRFTRRSPERIADVKQVLAERGIQILRPAAEQFGAEPKDEWIVLGLGTPHPGDILAPRPKDVWFSDIMSRQFGSEREVDSFFVIPLMLELEYTIRDIAQGCPVEVSEGSKHRPAVADVVLFDGEVQTEDTALLVVESKAVGKLLTPDGEAQARSYALWLCAPYYMVTNGDDLVVYENLGGPQRPIEVMRLRREELRERWNEFAAKLNRKAVVARKAQIAETLKKARTATS